MKKDKTIFIIFIIIIISTMLIGNPISKNDNLINIIIGISGIYIIIKAQKENKLMIKSKTAIAMLMLLITSAFPLISNTYLSLNGTVQYIFRYVSLFIMCIIISFSLNKNEENLEKIKDILVISGIILVIFGIDLLTTNLTYDFTKKIIGVVSDQKSLTRMYSLFLYSNTFAVSVAVPYMICVEKVLNKKEKLYTGISTFLLSGILLSQSRATLLILLIVGCVALIIVKGEDRRELIKLIAINFIFALLYVLAFEKMKKAGLTTLIWILTILIPIISAFAFSKLMLSKSIDKLFKIKYFIIIFIIIVITILILSIFKTDLVLFNDKNSQSKVTKNIYDVSENTQYKIELDIEAKSDTLNDNYKVELIQRDNYSDNLGEVVFEFNNYNGIKEFYINTVDGIKWIEFSISAKKTGINREVKVKSLSVNGKPFTLNYKFLPTDMIAQLRYMNLSQRSIQERKTFIIDGLNVIKEYGILGVGGDGYQYAIKDVQSYYYGTSQMHCYILQIAIEFGLVGVLAFAYIITLTIINIVNIIKNEEKDKYSIVFAFITLFLHSMIDFDMTFFYTMIIFYTLIAIINYKKYNDEKKNIAQMIVIISIILLCTTFNTNEEYVKITKENSLKNVRTYEEKTKLERMYMYMVPYSAKYRIDRIEYIELYSKVKENELSENEKMMMRNELINLLKKEISYEKRSSNIIAECIKLLENADNDEEKELAYETINSILSKHRYDADQILRDYVELEKLNEERINEYINKNIKKSIENIRKYKKCRITKEKAEEIIETIKERKNFD